jgi:RNA polymerase sigma-70 factor (ECF subfamily)
VLHGQSDAYGELVERYEKSVFATAGAILRDWHDVQDVAQESFLLAFKELGRLRDTAKFGPWVTRVARTQALRLLRERGRAKAAIESRQDDMPGTNHRLPEPDRDVLKAIMKLPARQQQVVLLRFFSGRTVNEISTITARPTGSVTSALSRAYRCLKGLLKETEQ